jgi:hypothetical protein
VVVATTSITELSVDGSHQAAASHLADAGQDLFVGPATGLAAGSDEAVLDGDGRRVKDHGATLTTWNWPHLPGFHWYDTQRLHEYVGYVAPAEFEALTLPTRPTRNWLESNSPESPSDLGRFRPPLGRGWDAPRIKSGPSHRPVDGHRPLFDDTDGLRLLGVTAAVQAAGLVREVVRGTGAAGKVLGQLSGTEPWRS